MSHKKKVFLFILLFIIIFFTGSIFNSPERFGLCNVDNWRCVDFWGDNFVQPVTLLPVPIVICLIILLFLRPEVFKTWAKFAAVALPLGIIWIVSTGVQDRGGGMGVMSIDREIITWTVSILFLFLSLILIIVKAIRLHIKLRRQGR